jgi:hypothetical protein
MPYPCLREPMGPPKFSTFLFLHARHSQPRQALRISPWHDLRSNVCFLCCLPGFPAVPQYLAHSQPNDSSVLASSVLTLSPPALSSLTRLKLLQGGADTPLAYKIRCVRFTSVCSRLPQIPSHNSAIRPGRNTRYGWVVSPYEESLPTPLPTGTCTQQETPSFAWRTKT